MLESSIPGEPPPGNRAPAFRSQVIDTNHRTLSTFLPQPRSTTRITNNRQTLTPESQSENSGLVTRQLYKTSPPGVWCCTIWMFPGEKWFESLLLGARGKERAAGSMVNIFYHGSRAQTGSGLRDSLTTTLSPVFPTFSLSPSRAPHLLPAHSLVPLSRSLLQGSVYAPEPLHQANFLARLPVYLNVKKYLAAKTFPMKHYHLSLKSLRVETKLKGTIILR